MELHCVLIEEAFHVQDCADRKIALIVWIVPGTAIAGVALMTVLLIPGLAGQAMSNIPRAAIVGFAVAMPVVISGRKEDLGYGDRVVR